MKRAGLTIAALTLLVVTVFVFQASNVSAVQTYCAKLTTYGAACQNVPFSQVDKSQPYSATSCDATTYCKSGTCVDTKTGNCLPNTPAATCDPASGGVWYDATPSNVPLCQQGCCFVGDQAAFVTQTRCQQLGTLYSINTSFRTDITDELTCISSAQPNAKGACVYETDSGRTCKFTTKRECQTLKAGGASTATFHQGFLCTNPELGTNCAPTDQTTCIPGQDQVYFVDSCGNQANVYDASKFTSKTTYDINYWSFTPDFSAKVTVPNSTNAAESPTNGNCDYYLGSTCRQYDKTIDGATNKPTYGDYICRSLSCNSGQYVSEFKSAYGRTPVNGETWCGSITGSSGTPQISIGENSGLQGTDFSNSTFSKDSNLPGSRDVRFVCYNGQVTVEPCADYRQEVCQQSSVTTDNTYYSASCVVNRWRDCYTQTSEQSCLDTSQRDCQWITGVSVLKDSNGTALVWDQQSDKMVAYTGKDDTNVQASCVPKYTPGLTSSEAQNICAIANSNCVVVFGASVFNLIGGSAGGIQKDQTLDLGSFINKGDSKVICLDGNGSIVDNTWLTAQSNLCMSLGDCGVSVNYVGTDGTNQKKDLTTVSKVNDTNSSS